MKLFNLEVRIVFSHLKESLLRYSKKLVVVVVRVVREVVKMKTVDIDKDVHDEPEESKRVHLEVREKSKSKHV